MAENGQKVFDAYDFLGREYSIPQEKLYEFFKHGGSLEKPDLSKPVNMYDQEGNRYELPRDRIIEFRTHMPDATFHLSEIQQHKRTTGRREELQAEGKNTDPGFLDKAGAFTQGVGEKLGSLADTAVAATAGHYGMMAKAGETVVDAVKGVGNMFKGDVDEKTPQEPVQKEQSFSDKAFDTAKDYWQNPKIEKLATDNLKPDYKPTFTDQAETMDNYRQAGKIVGSLPEMAVGGALLKGAGLAINMVRGGELVGTLPKSIEFLNKFLTIKPTPTNLASISAGSVLSEKFQNKNEQKTENSFEGQEASHPDPYMDKIERQPFTGENFLRSIAGFMVGGATIEVGASGVRAATKIASSVKEGLKYTNEGESSGFTEFVKEVSGKAVETIKDVNLNPIKGLYKFIVKGGDNELDTVFLNKINPKLTDPNTPKAEMLAAIEADKELLNSFSIYQDNKRAYDVARLFPSYVYTKKILPEMDDATIGKMKKTIGNRILDLDPHDPQSTVNFQSERLKTNTKQYINAIEEEHSFLHKWYTEALSDMPNNAAIPTIMFQPKHVESLDVLTAKFKPFSTESTSLGQVYNITKNLANKVRTSNAVDPTEILNERSVLNNIAYGSESGIKLNKNQKTLLNTAINTIDEILLENVNTGNLKPEFLSRFNKSKQFDTEIYYANINNDVIKSIVSGEKPRYAFMLMDSPEGYLKVKEALTGVKSDIANNKQTFKSFRPASTVEDTLDFKLFEETNINRMAGKSDKKLTATKLKKRKNEIFYNKKNIYGEEQLKKSKEIFKILETLKVQEIIFEDIVKNKKLNYSDVISNIQGMKYGSALEHILGDKVSKDLRDNVVPILQKLEKIDYNSNIYNASLRKSVEESLGVGVSQTGNVKLSSNVMTMAGGAAGFVASGGIGGAAIGATAGWMLSAKLAKGFAIAASDPKTIARLIKLSHSSNEKGFFKYLYRLGNTDTQKVNIYNKVNTKENRKDAKEAITPSKETAKSMVEWAQRAQKNIAY